MKKEDEKISELKKLRQLAPFPIEASFITGYLAFGVPLEQANQIKDLVQQVIVMVYEQLITSHNMLELLIMLKFDLLAGKHLQKAKTLQQLLEPYLNELALDNSYLSRRYFQMEVRKEDIVPESMGIECSICLVDIMSSDLCILTCGHMFHRNCLSEYSKEKIINKIIPFDCPQEGCKSQIIAEEVGDFLPKELKEKYEDFAFHNYVDAHMDDTSWCPTPGCSAVFTFDAALTNYRCPACKKHYCLACKCEFHTNFTCAQYKEMSSLDDDDKKFMMLVKGAKYKQCPNCKFWVEKKDGCDHMTCRCKYEFCYVCGGKYNRCKCQGYEDEIIVPRAPEPIELRAPHPHVPMFRPLRPPASLIKRASQSDRSDSSEEVERVIAQSKRKFEGGRIREAIAKVQEERRLERKRAEESLLLQEVQKEEVERRFMQRQKKRQTEEMQMLMRRRMQEMQRQRKRKMEQQMRKREQMQREQRKREEIDRERQRKVEQERRKKEEENKRNQERQARQQRIKEAEKLRQKLQEQRERITMKIKEKEEVNSSKVELQFQREPFKKVKSDIDQPKKQPHFGSAQDGKSMILLSSKEEKKPDSSLESMIRNYSNSPKIEEKREPLILSIVDQEQEEKKGNDLNKFPTLSLK